MSYGVEYEERKSAFSNRLQSFAIKNLVHKDIDGFLNNAFTIFELRVKETLREQFVLKVGACFLAKLVRKKEIVDDKETENVDHSGEKDTISDENDVNMTENRKAVDTIMIIMKKLKTEQIYCWMKIKLIKVKIVSKNCKIWRKKTLNQAKMAWKWLLMRN